jgi:hypothetical protein
VFSNTVVKNSNLDGIKPFTDSNPSSEEIIHYFGLQQSKTLPNA